MTKTTPLQSKTYEIVKRLAAMDRLQARGLVEWPQPDKAGVARPGWATDAGVAEAQKLGRPTRSGGSGSDD